MPRVPTWIKLAAASKDELLSEVMLAIEELGGMEEAEKALRELASDKKSNWVMTERFVVSKSHDEALMELVQDALDSKPMRPAPRPQEQETPKEETKAPKNEEPSGPPEKARPEKLEGRGAFLYALLAILLGGAALSTVNLKNINLQKTIQDIKQGDPKVPGRGEELASEPLTPPEPAGQVLQTPEDVDKWRAENEERIEVWRKQVEDITDPQEKADEAKDLEQFELRYKMELKQVEKALAEEEGNVPEE